MLVSAINSNYSQIKIYQINSKQKTNNNDVNKNNLNTPTFKNLPDSTLVGSFIDWMMKNPELSIPLGIVVVGVLGIGFVYNRCINS